jgi:hypothetical protein
VQWPSLPPFPQKKQVDDDLRIYIQSITFFITYSGKLAAYDGDALRVSRIANKRMNHAGSEPLGEDEVFFVRLRVSQSCG